MGYRHDAGERYKETRSQCRETLGIRFGQVPENGGIRASTGEGFGQVPKKLRASIREGSGRVPEKVSGKYRKSSGRVPEKGSGKYRKMVEFGQIPKKGIELGRDAEEPAN